jgi:hypothetical protein
MRASNSACESKDAFSASRLVVIWVMITLSRGAWQFAQTVAVLSFLNLHTGQNFPIEESIID